MSDRRAAVLWSQVFGGVLLASCSDPFPFDNAKVEPPESDVCPASREWLEDPNGTPPLEMFKPLPHPGGECVFYRAAWQSFLISMQPDARGLAAIASYPTIDTVFKSKVAHRPDRAVLGGIKQAGGRQIVIDQNGNPLYYGIHVNAAFADFIKELGLETAEAIKAYPSDPVLSKAFFPAGVSEFKTAWQIVEGDVAAETADYISMTTTVPTLVQDPVTRGITEDRDRPRTVTVRLLSVHVVFTLPGHPEFIWASFEHSTGAPDASATDDHRDVAPIVPDDQNPSDDDPTGSHNTIEVSDRDFLLYRAHTPANEANKAIDETNLVLVDQKFPGQQTSIYRMFPASKSNTTEPDGAITSLNHNVEALFLEHQDTLDPADKRGHYRMLGALWMDKPGFFQVDRPIQNDATSPLLAEHLENGKRVEAVPLEVLKRSIVEEGSDSPLSILAGEDRMSSTALESFTQAPDSFNNCFTCHNTQAITAKGIPLSRDPGGEKLLDPGLLNVSHVLTDFLRAEGERG